MEVPVSLMEFLVYSKCKEQETLVDFFVWSFTFYDAFRGIGLSKLFFLFLADKIKLEIRICTYECISKCVFMTYLNYVNVFWWMFF